MRVTSPLAIFSVSVGTRAAAAASPRAAAASVIDIEIGDAGRGVYSLSGGSLQVISDTNVGYGGTGTFNLSGAGNFSIGNTLNIGRDEGSSGSFTQSGGSLSSSWPALAIPAPAPSVKPVELILSPIA